MLLKQVNLQERDLQGGLGVEIGINTRNWVDSAPDRDYSRAIANAALNIQVP